VGYPKAAGSKLFPVFAMFPPPAIQYSLVLALLKLEASELRLLRTSR
jgi:hypothetical protein